MFYYAIYDRKLRAFGQLTALDFKETDAVIRWMKDFLQQNPQNMFNRHAEDFELHYIGHWEDKDGRFVEDKLFVCNLIDLQYRPEEKEEN